ncbi:phage major head protein (major coat protein) [Escherichia coli]|nr:phage major head protein (major coat protein) [Escherichia coli]
MEIIYVCIYNWQNYWHRPSITLSFDPLFLRLFFRETYPFTTEKVYLSQIPGLVNMALYVSPIVSGEVIRSRGGSTSEFTPGYVKPKHEVNPQMTLASPAG